MTRLNQLRTEALGVLLNETFRCVEQQMHEGFVALAAKNAQMRNMKAQFFTTHGEVFPTKTPNGASITGIRVTAPPLHFTLIEEFDNIRAIKQRSNFTAIKNFYGDVLTISRNGIVLDALLPAVLVSSLRKKFNPGDYRRLDHGQSPHQYAVEPIETTQENIQKIKDHYQFTIITLRDLLMDNLLLQ